jgi:hypothetical protein
MHNHVIQREIGISSPHSPSHYYFGEEMSNEWAYHPSDKSKALVNISEWQTKYGPEAEGRCRVCDLPIKIRAEKSASCKAHFAHFPHTPCPTIIKNHVPYAALSALPRDPSVADAAKAFVRDNAVTIYEKCQKEILPRLSWKEFLSLVEKANEIDVWSLKDMPHFFLPYVLMTCADKFNAQSPKRPHDCFFVLEPFPSGASNLWNFSTGYKKYLWRVDLPARDVEKIEINPDLGVPWFLAKLYKTLA